MAVEIPKEPKKYTSVYDNFKGVDFTNDHSNVYRRRSPDGLNMLPDTDGRPYKRTGWEIEFPYTEFLQEGETSVDTKRIHHFSLGGTDYMVFFNTSGVFYVNNVDREITKCQLKNGSLITDFPPQIDDVDFEADSGRSFFFEGKGMAGFYTFVGTELFRFDGQYYYSVEPYIPKVLIACDENGAGETYEAVNLLTRKRTVQYQCNGTSTQFVVPGGVKSNTETIELLNGTTGEWEELTTGYSISDGVITFTTAPSAAVSGEDNMRITYAPDVDDASSGEVTENANAILTTYETKTRITTLKYDAKNKQVTKTTHTAWEEDSGGWTRTPATFKLTNVSSLADVAVTPEGGSKQFSAYSDKYEYYPTIAMYEETTPAETTDIRTISKYGTSHNDAESAEYNATSNGKYSFDTLKAAKNDLNNRAPNDTSCYIAYYEQKKTTKVYTLQCTATYEQAYFIDSDLNAFMACQRSFVYGSGKFNQVFMSSSTLAGYQSRVWYSAASDPSYFPDTNYIEAGGDDTHITGMMKVSGYVGIIKQGSALDASVYLAYPTTFDEDATFAVKQSINGVGALSYGAFNLLNAEPVFLSKEGVVGIEVSDEEIDRKIRSRSYFINKKLCAEENLGDAISFVYKGLYYLAINNRCYVLDGSQKTSWANEKTNLQYEAYYLENTPVQCFASMGGDLYFTDFDGNVCKFMSPNDIHPYRDAYSVDPPDATSETEPYGDDMKMDIESIEGDVEIGSTIRVIPAEPEEIEEQEPEESEETEDAEEVEGTEEETGEETEVAEESWYTVVDMDDEHVWVTEGVPIKARWSTISDDDGMVHFFKTMQKKGCVVSLLPQSDSGVEVSVRQDEKAPVRIGRVDVSGNFLPYDYFIKKKFKKYKRLQIICENNNIDESFGIDQIIKTYTIGNYSKNKR